MNREDLVLRTLRDVRTTVAPDIPADLLESIYKILAGRQFDSDPTSAKSFVDDLIEDYLNQKDDETAAAGGQLS